MGYVPLVGVYVWCFLLLVEHVKDVIQTLSPFAWSHDGQEFNPASLWSSEGGAGSSFGLLVVERLHREAENQRQLLLLKLVCDQGLKVFLFPQMKRSTSLSHIWRIKKNGCQFFYLPGNDTIIDEGGLQISSGLNEFRETNCIQEIVS